MASKKTASGAKPSSGKARPASRAKAKGPTQAARAKAPVARAKAAPAKKAPAQKAAKAKGKAGTATLEHVVELPAPPLSVYEALVDADKHAAFTCAKATGAARVGASFTAWDGYISGKHLELVPGERIVQSWTTSEWPAGAPPSRLELTLEVIPGGTRLTMIHSDVPASQAEAYDEGWVDHYWAPLRAFLGG